MHSDNNLAQSLHNIHHAFSRFSKLLKPAPLVAAMLLITIIAAASWFLFGIMNTKPAHSLLPSMSPRQTLINPTSATLKPRHTNDVYSATPPASSGDHYTGWRTFVSNTEGITIHYPDTWTVDDHSDDNCGHTQGRPIYKAASTTPYDYCRDSFTFLSPDGVVNVGYSVYSDDNNDRLWCGVQSPCESRIVGGLENVDIKNLGQVLLVNDGQQMALHKPIDSYDTPVIGANAHEHYAIMYSLPSKRNGRLSILLSPPSLRRILTDQQFYNTESMREAIKILKSVEY